MLTELIEEISRDRHRLDAIARAIVTGERGLGTPDDEIADDVASLMINRLAAAHAPGHTRVSHLEWNAPERWEQLHQKYGRDLLDLLSRRTEKHLAQAAMVALTRGDP